MAYDEDFASNPGWLCAHHDLWQWRYSPVDVTPPLRLTWEHHLKSEPAGRPATPMSARRRGSSVITSLSCTRAGCDVSVVKVENCCGNGRIQSGKTFEICEESHDVKY